MQNHPVHCLNLWQRIWALKICRIFKLRFPLLALSTTLGINFPLVFALHSSDAVDILLPTIPLILATSFAHCKYELFEPIHTTYVPYKLTGCPSPHWSATGAGALCCSGLLDHCEDASRSRDRGAAGNHSGWSQHPGPQIWQLLRIHCSKLSRCDLRMLPIVLGIHNSDIPN